MIARAYDIVLDGVEVGAGSVRNHDLALHVRLQEAEIDRCFGDVLGAFRWGLPPHAGAALGLDRLRALGFGERAIAEITTVDSGLDPRDSFGKDAPLGGPCPRRSTGSSASCAAKACAPKAQGSATALR